MIPWLDFRIFGNGRGLKSPYFSARFYWLVDAHTERGTFYTWSGGYGAQLHSIQWTHPKAHEVRCLNGVEFRAFSSSRRWGRVRVSWEARGGYFGFSNQKLAEFESQLGNSLKHR